MHKRVGFLVLAVVLIAAGCSENRNPSPLAPTTQNDRATGIDLEASASAIVAQAGWPVSVETVGGAPAQAQCEHGANIEFLGRQVISGDVAHYAWRVQVGPGPYEEIHIHRVVRENAAHRPISTPTSYFLLHGDWKNFEGCFLPSLHSSSLQPDFGFAVFLAQHDVDVWGIDQAWALVPAEVTDCSFMADWGMQKHVDWTNAAVEIARIVRRMTGSGYRKMGLFGYSGGSALGFAVINEDAGRRPGNRKISAFIGLDQGVHTDNPDWDQAMCSMAATYQAMIDTGQYQDFVALPYFGEPAREDPEGASELIPGFTNYQAALGLGSMPMLVPGFPSHFLAGIFDEAGTPTGLQYTNPDGWIDFLCYAPAYEAAAFERDEYLWCCSSAGDVPWDDNFSRVRIPIFFVAIVGGFGVETVSTLDLLGTADKSCLIVTAGSADPLLDFGHIDAMLASNAPQLVWQPILDWIDEHGRARESVPGAVTVAE